MIDDDTDDDDPDYADEESADHDGSKWDDECCLGAACLNPHPYHFASECFDLEMAEASMSYAEQEGIAPERTP